MLLPSSRREADELTHTLTQTAKRADGNNGQGSSKEQPRPGKTASNGHKRIDFMFIRIFKHNRLRFQMGIPSTAMEDGATPREALTGVRSTVYKTEGAGHVQLNMIIGQPSHGPMNGMTFIRAAVPTHSIPGILMWLLTRQMAAPGGFNTPETGTGRRQDGSTRPTRHNIGPVRSTHYIITTNGRRGLGPRGASRHTTRAARSGTWKA